MLFLFDLDGTIIDSQIGVFAGIRHSLTTVGADIPDESILRSWIGPPLRVSFGEVLAGDSERVEAAVDAYTQRFHDVGWTEHTVYEGIAELVATLSEAGHQLAVVTSKTRPHAEPIIAHLPFGHRFERIYAPDPSSAVSEKAEMVAAALRDFGHDPADTVMIGDRLYDMEGAVANKVRGIGVLWGFGHRDELMEAGAWKVVETPAQIAEIVGLTVKGSIA